jgi:hypothetical protein
MAEEAAGVVGLAGAAVVATTLLGQLYDYEINISLPHTPPNKECAIGDNNLT